MNKRRLIVVPALTADLNQYWRLIKLPSWWSNKPAAILAEDTDPDTLWATARALVGEKP